jgi:hypothetical protein
MIDAKHPEMFPRFFQADLAPPLLKFVSRHAGGWVHGRIDGSVLIAFFFFLERLLLLSVVRICVACYEATSRRARRNVGWGPCVRDCGESDHVQTHLGCVGVWHVRMGILLTVLEGCATEGF